MSAAIAFYTIQESIKPADEDHPFGHGKLETLSSLIESLLLIVAALWIVIEAIDHLKNPHPIEYPWAAIGIMAFSAIASYAVYLNNVHAARKTQSSAIQVNALHFLADVISSVGIFLGLIILKLTGWLWIDPLLGVLVAGYIFSISMPQIKRAIRELTDTRLPEDEVKAIESILRKYDSKAIETHDLKTRKSGVHRHVDFHMVMCGQMSVNDSHKICDEIEAEIKNEFQDSHVSIHVEPCSEVNPHCKEICDLSTMKRKRIKSHE